MDLFVSTYIQMGEIFLSPEESHHISKVLRFNIGQRLYLTDGKGTLAVGCLTRSHHRNAIVQVLEVTQQTRPKPIIHLYVSPTKATDRTEWLIEKATELGIGSINFVTCERTARKNINLERYYKIAIAAAKQSLNCYFPEVRFIPKLNHALETARGEKLFAFCEGEDRLAPQMWPINSGDYSLFIGPEGDFTPQEITVALSEGCKPVELGALRLRTETAALAGISFLRLREQR
ncbi:MAG: RsmE family RNA methyltransferase [Thermaurantimonas sp.]